MINLPIGLVLLAAVLIMVPPRPADRSVRIDVIGALLLVTAILAVVIGASLAEQPGRRLVAGGSVIAGVLIMVGFRIHQRRAARPLVPPEAWRSTALRAGATLAFVNTATTSSAAVLLTIQLQQGLGASALQAGLTLLPFSLGVVVGSALATPIGRLWGDRRLSATGLLGIALGVASLTVTVGVTRIGALAGVAVIGVGLGLAAVASTGIGTSVPSALSGSAAGLVNTGGQLGTAVGVATFVTLAAIVRPGAAGAQVAWGTIAVLAAAVSLVMAIRSRSGRPSG